jgi:hypothetical protein
MSVPQARRRFIEQHSDGYAGHGVWDRRDQSYVWVRRGASEATARAVARVLEVLVPAGDLAALSAGGLREVLAPVSDHRIDTPASERVS